MKAYLFKRWPVGLSDVNPDFAAQYQVINAYDWYEANEIAGHIIHAYMKSHGYDYEYEVKEIMKLGRG